MQAPTPNRVRSDAWAVGQALKTMECARRLTRERGQPPTSWALTLLWENGRKEVHPLPCARTLQHLVRRVRQLRHERHPAWLYVAGKLTYRSQGAELPHIVVFLVGQEHGVMVHSAIDSDGNPGDARVLVDPDPALLGPLRNLAR